MVIGLSEAVRMGSSVSWLSGMALSANCSLPVLQVLFPEHSSEGAEWMISSSADGLISVMDLRDGLDEDNAFRVSSLSSRPNPSSKIVGEVTLLKNPFGRVSFYRACHSTTRMAPSLTWQHLAVLVACPDIYHP